MFASVVEKFGKVKTFGAIGIVIFIALATWAGLLNGPIGMVPLYTDLSNADKYEVVRLLNQVGAEYSIAEDSVLVDAQKVREYRMYLAAEGVPSGGSIVGYEIFNKEDTFSTSSFTQNVNLLRALEGEISRTIMSFDHIKMARVHLAVPKREPFSRVKPEASASVILKLQQNTKLTKKEADAISNFIASAVAGLRPDNVTIVSTEGKALKLPSSEDSASFANHEYKLEIEKHFRDVIEDLVGKSLGAGKVRAEVSVDLDFDRLVTNSETYDPSGQALRSTQSTEEHSKASSTQGDVSVANNIPGGGGSGGEGSGSSLDKTDEVNNYEISKEEKKYMKSIGSVKRMSIAVLVDGSYQPSPTPGGAGTYIPRTPDALMQIRSLVVSAIGFDAARGDKIEVINMQFSSDPTVVEPEHAFSLLLYQIDRILIAVIVFVFAALFSFFVLKPIAMRVIDRNMLVAKIADGAQIGADGKIVSTSDNKTAVDNTDGTGEGIAKGTGDDNTRAAVISEAAAQSALEAKAAEEKRIIAEELNRMISENNSHAAALLRRLIRESE